MRCSEFERLACDYLDDTLPHERRRAMDDHLLDCAGCREALDEAAFAASCMAELPEVEPPAGLVGAIIQDTVGVGSGSLAPAAGDSGGFFGFLNPFFQPRFVMGMAMTAVSFSMLTFYGAQAVRGLRGGAEASPTVELAQTTRTALEGGWERAGEMLEAARKFYEWQTLSPAADEAPAAAEESR